ncbi:MAG: endonuclease [Crocinitomicaceae bacterium]|nr:endonuclease [Crocinitomicaceae bacterium]MBP6033277.1 endonuclease [Crocinitomicaceae bacterium]
MTKGILSFFALFTVLSLKAQTISQVRNLGIGQTVTVTGVVTNGSELGSIRYLQDGTAGIACYGSSLSSVQRGDSITATGVLFDFSGLLELSPTNSFINHGPAVLPLAQTIPFTSGTESLEAQLVRFDNVTFVQTGNFATGNSTVQVSNGTSTFDVRVNGSTNIDGTAIPTGPISIVGLLGQFNANYQIIPRNLLDIFPYVAPAREINVKVNGSTVLNNDTYIVGTTAATNVTIENTGVSALTLSGVTFTGANASEFGINLTTGTVAGLGSNSYSLTFTPTGTGTRTATISIANNDSDENPYIINLYAIGTNNLATEPTSNPSNLTFPLVKAYTVGGQYTAGTNAENYIVLWKNGSAVTGMPTDGTSYKRGDVVGDARVAYIGSGTGFTPRGIIANQNYHFAVYAFNGPAGFENYKTTTPAIGNVTSQGEQIGNYYAGITSGSTTFLSDLSALINPHTVVSYFNYKTTVMNQFEIRDTTNGQSFVTCVYSGERKVFDEPFDWSAQGYSREHSYCHSWMPTFPCDNPEQPEYSDQHNLWPTNLQQANTPRSNLPMMDIDGNVVFTYLEGSVGYSGNQLVYEPRAAQKGNAARSIFYMATAYNTQGGNNWQLPTNQSQESLKTWHFNDLPDNYEIARNEFIFSKQANRNPYVDSVNFACHVNFANMSYLVCDAGIDEKLAANFTVFPVPTSDKLFAQVNGLDIVEYTIMDMQGRVIKSSSNIQVPVLELGTTEFKSGMYLLQVGTTFGQVQREFIVE